MKSVIETWETRWLNSPDKYRASWPDEYARDLELREVARHYASLPETMEESKLSKAWQTRALPVLELGCGQNTIVEGGHCFFKEYVGLDSSETAIEKATYQAHNRPLFAYADLTQPKMQRWVAGILKTRPHFLISRRFLINLTQKERKPLIELLTLAPHGILIETEAASMKQMNLARGKQGRAALQPQPHNFWLTSSEAETTISHTKAERRMFMSEYYYASRIVDQKRYDTARNKKAWERQLEVNKYTSGLAGDPSYGLTAFCW